MADTPETEVPKRRTRKAKTDASGAGSERRAARAARKATGTTSTSASPPKPRRHATQGDTTPVAAAAAKVRSASKSVGAASGKAARTVKDKAKSAGITRKGIVAGAAVAVVGVAAGLAATIGRKKIVAASGEIAEKAKEGAAKVKAKIDEVRGEDTPPKPETGPA